jgi:hypothetical protein
LVFCAKICYKVKSDSDPTEDYNIVTRVKVITEFFFNNQLMGYFKDKSIFVVYGNWNIKLMLLKGGSRANTPSFDESFH